VPKHLRDHGLFIAFAPPDKPQIAVAVVVENGGSGSRSAAPIARRVTDYYLNTLKNRAADEDLMLSDADAILAQRSQLH
jgi:penicillin-binding protein 2